MDLKKIFCNRTWVEGRLQPATIWIQGNTIAQVEMSKSPGAIDVGDAVMMPGCIDAHVHVNEPGRTDWEGFETATSAAAGGGITTIIDMPLNASPVTTTELALISKLASTKNKLNVNAGFYGGLIPGNAHEIELLCNDGALGIKAFLTHSGIPEFPNAGYKDLDIAMPILKKMGKPLLVHCELSDEHHLELLKEQPNSYAAYLQSRPSAWEDDAISMMIGLCRKHRCKTHIVHVASATALQMIADAKNEGLPLTAETCPHYIFFSAEDIPDGSTVHKCAPPIRLKQNNEQLKLSFQNNTLDFLASDHSPAPPSIKELESGNFLKAWGGIAGLQFLLSAGWTALMDCITLEQFIPLLTGAPAKFLGIQAQKGTIAKGMDADLVIWQPEKHFVVQQQDILHRHKACPYTGKQLFGKVLCTIVNGETVFENDKIIHKNCGSWVLKK